MDFDYIIIGAGSAGCVLANRLSVNPELKILLIEAGGKDSKPEIHIPGGYLKLHHSNADWNCYWTEPQAQLLNRKIYHPRGKVWGGSSSTNAMAYVRGNRADYDLWNLLGNKGWGYEDVLPYFMKSENNEQILNQYHGKGGPLNVTFSKYYETELAQAFVEACVQSGIPRNEDFNGAQQEGAGRMQFTIRDAKRCSTAAAFLVPVLNRKNLVVMSRTHTIRILIEGDKATGIEFKKSGILQTIKASKEVILSGGAFASPQLLMLSGVGPADILKRHRIEIKRELPGVGENLQDHLFYAVSSLCSKPISNNHWFPWYKQGQALFNYLILKRGPLTVGPLEANAFLKSSPEKVKPDIQFQFTPTHAGNDYTTDLFDINTFPLTDGYTILPTQVNPKSRGWVRISSPDPMAAPLIDPHYLEHEEDRVTMVKGGRKALEILEADAFSEFRIKTHCPAIYDSDDDILNHIRKSAECVYHPVGTCKMGDDEWAVVDSQLKVNGIGHLRVVDASVMPTISSGNTNAPTIMIAEKAADLILRSIHG